MPQTSPSVRDSIGSAAMSGNGQSCHPSNAESDVAAENRTLLMKVNDYKAKTAVLESKVQSQEVQIGILTREISALREQSNKADTEKKTLEKLVDELMEKNQTMTQKTARGAANKLTVSFPRQYLSVALAVEKRCSTWAARETMELVPFQDSFERNWSGKAIIRPLHGVRISEACVVAPTPPFKIASRGTFYTPSTESEMDALRLVTSSELEDDAWGDVFKTQQSKEEVMTLILNHPVFKAKMKQCLSDACSARKRAARDIFFSSYGYQRLQSRYSPVGSDSSRSKEEEIQCISSKVPYVNDNSKTPLFDFWRSSPQQSLLFGTQGSSPCLPNRQLSDTPGHDTGRNDEDAEDNEERLSLFSSSHSVFVFQQFLGFDPTTTSPHTSTSIMVLARLDAWLNTVIQLLGSQDGRGGKLQKKYSDMFGTFLQDSTAQLVGRIQQFVGTWEAIELTIPSQ